MLKTLCCIASLVLTITPLRAQVAMPVGADPQWTIRESRSALELLPELRVRAKQGKLGSTRALNLRRSSAQDADLGDASQGVVYNHAMRAYGALSGEISLRTEPGADGASLAQRAGLQLVQRIGQSDYWVGRVASPQALRDTLLSLRATPGVLEARWVVTYGLPRQAIDNARTATR